MHTITPPGPATRLRPGDTPSIGRDQPEVAAQTPAPPTIDLVDALTQTWRSIGAAYEVTAQLPDMPCLLDGVNPKAPAQAAEAIVANMLLEVIEHVGRFSPAYQKPIGLIHIRDHARDRSRWLLSPETRQRWQALLTPLAIAIEKNTGLILAADLLGDLLDTEPCDGVRVMAHCERVPPHVILINRGALTNANLECDQCRRPFRPIEMAGE